MFKKVIFICLLTIGVHYFSLSQPIEALRQRINKVVEGKSATVGVAIWGTDPGDSLSILGSRHLPMQSVYKYHLALAVLHQVDQGKLSLDQVVSIDKSLMETYQHLWSPLREANPDGVDISLAEVIRYTVAWSDNVGCDLLFDLVGGTNAVESYLHSIGIRDIAVVHKEIVMQADWESQYDNWTTVTAANQALKLFFENKEGLWSQESHQFLLEVLKGTKTGTKRIRGLLPEETIVAHKTGYSGKNEEGLSGAVNNIGVVFLPTGTHFYISVFVSDSVERDETNQRMIAEIARLAWDHFNER